MSSDNSKSHARVRDRMFTEISLREKRIPEEIIQKGWTIVEEMESFGINRTLSSILIERKLIDRNIEKEVFEGIGKIKVTCTRCNKKLFLSELDKDGRIKCERCESLLGLSLEENSDNSAIEERLTSVEIQAVNASGTQEPVAKKAKEKIHKTSLYMESIKTIKKPSLEPPKKSLEPTKKIEEPASIIQKPVRSAIKRFHIESVLRTGPFGRLYYAFIADDVKKSTPCALKVLSKDNSASTDAVKNLERVLKELNATSEVSHSLQQENNLVYLIRPFLDDPFMPLADIQIPKMQQREKVVLDIACAVEDIHKQGKVHGNLKPTNIFIRADGKVDKILLVDPGLHLLVPHKNDTQRLKILSRAPCFRSPEEIRGDTLTLATDVYALGWVFYTILSGDPPFMGISTPEVLDRHQHGPCPELSSDRGRWREFIQQMTSPIPKERPRDATEVVKIVDKLVAGKRVQVLPVSPRKDPVMSQNRTLPRKKKFFWRYALGPVMLIIVLGWTGWCFKLWQEATALQAAENRSTQIYESMAKENFLMTSASVKASPEKSHELWSHFIEVFSDSPMKSEAELELNNCPPEVDIDASLQNDKDIKNP